MQENTPEQALLDIPANLWRSPEAVGGRLQVTNLRLIFQSHALNFRTGPTEIPLADVQEVTPCNTMKIVPNGVRVLLKSGDEYRFVVSGRGKVIEAIRAHAPGL